LWPEQAEKARIVWETIGEVAGKTAGATGEAIS
jgi:hypothetical protein